MSAAKFITFEGGEGSGKSTQARLLADRLRGQGLSVLVTREPGGSPFAEQLRSLLLDPQTAPHTTLSEALLFYAARADHLDKVIRPALAAGRWVICDRFSDSTRVYQGLAGGLPERLFDALDAAVVAPTFPDLTIVLDVAPGVGLARAIERRLPRAPDLQHPKDEAKASGTEGAPASLGAAPPPPDAYERRDLAFHERLRAGFLDLVRRNPRRCVLIESDAEKGEVSALIWKAVSARLLAGAR